MAGHCAAVVPAGVVVQSAGRALGKIRKSFRAAMLVALRLNPIRIWIFDGIRNRLIPARDFFLEKKQKRARCSGLPSRFILCRTCRAKAACLGGVSVCIPYAAGAACSSRTVRHARTRLWPYACAQGAAPRGAVMRCGRQMRWFRRARWRKRRRRTAIEERFLGLRSLWRCV